MKKIFNFMLSLLVLVTQILCVNGCKLKDFFDEPEIIYKENADVESNPNTDGNEEETYEDKYLYAGLTEEEWKAIDSKLVNSTFKEINFESKNATVKGKRNRGLLAVYNNSNEEDFNSLVEYLENVRRVIYNENGVKNATLNNTYLSTKLYLGYTDKKNKQYEYSVILFLENEKYNNKSYPKGSLLISIMECVNSQQSTPLQYSQTWLTDSEQKVLGLEKLIFPNGYLITSSERNNLPCKYGDSKEYIIKMEGNDEQFDILAKSIYDSGFKYDSAGNEYDNYKHSKLYQGESSKRFSAYRFVDNVEYYVYIATNSYTYDGITFSAEFTTNKKDEDRRKTWLTVEEKEQYGIMIDVDLIKPNFTSQQDVEEYSLFFDYITFFYHNVTLEQAQEYCKNKIYAILVAHNRNDEDDGTSLKGSMTIDPYGHAYYYSAVYNETDDYIYTIEIEHIIKGHNIWVGGLYTYPVSPNFMTITFGRELKKII